MLRGGGRPVLRAGGRVRRVKLNHAAGFSFRRTGENSLDNPERHAGSGERIVADS